MKKLILGVVFTAIASSFVFGQVSRPGHLPFHVNNRLRVELDDNIYLTNAEEQDSFKIIEQLELIKNLDFDRSLLSLRYTPSFTWWSDRDDDDTDLHHQFDALYRLRLTENTGLNISELLRYSELPEVIDGSTIVRENNDFLYNALSVGVDTRFARKWIADAEYKWNTLGYDDDEVSVINDYDQNIIGTSLRYELNPSTEIGGELRFADYDYEDDGRDANSTQYGVVVKRQLSDRLAANFRAGFEQKDLDGANTEDADGAYVGGSITANPAEGTTFEVGANFSPAESPIAPYANQERSAYYARLNRALTPKINWNVAGIYSDSDFSADETSRFDGSAAEFADGSEDVLQLSTRLSYEINRAHSIEANYQRTDLSSDVRAGSEFERNRVSLGWRLSL